MGQSSISKQKTASKQNNAPFNQNMDMATSQTFSQSFSQSDSQAEDQRNTPVFNKKSYQQAKQMAETDQKKRIPINTAIINSKSSSSGKRDHQISNDQLLNLKVKWIHILLILRQ